MQGYLPVAHLLRLASGRMMPASLKSKLGSRSAGSGTTNGTCGSYRRGEPAWERTFRWQLSLAVQLSVNAWRKRVDILHNTCAGPASCAKCRPCRTWYWPGW